jgi:PHP family Zn ribbon phosphoesterase
MTPRDIVEKAASLGINIIAICDHNSAENVSVTRDLALKKGIQVVAGMEINSSEEVHILGLFGNIEDACKMQEVIYDNLQPGENDEDTFGMQVVVNEIDEVLGFNKRLLIGATGLSVDSVVDLIHRFNGLAVASHIDREGYGIIGQLGFIPQELRFDALEISRRTSPDEARIKFSSYQHLPWISSSDAHRLEDIGKRTTSLFMQHSTFEELRLALKGAGGRKVTF